MRKIYLVLIMAVAALALTAACRPTQEAPQEERVIPVRMAAVEIREMAEPLHTFGRLASKKQMHLAFKTGGIIERIFVDEGQTAAKGSLLARLDLAEIQAQVKQAESALQKARRDLERVKKLYDEKAATLEQFQDVQTAYEIARSQWDAAEFNLKHSEIRAPARGKILKRLKEENEIAGPGMVVFAFASLDQDWVVRVGVSDRDLVRVQLNDPATVTFDAYPGEEFKAFVGEIVEAADVMTGTYEIELRMEKGDKRLVSGFVARADIMPSQTHPYQVIPIDALTAAEGLAGTVFTVDRQSMTAVPLAISIGYFFEDRIAVLSGLEDTAEVVTDGAPYLDLGTKVEIRESGQSPNAEQTDPNK